MPGAFSAADCENLYGAGAASTTLVVPVSMKRLLEPELAESLALLKALDIPRDLRRVSKLVRYRCGDELPRLQPRRRPRPWRRLCSPVVGGVSSSISSFSESVWISGSIVCGGAPEGSIMASRR